ncbi:arabinosaccharide transport system permease protein [Caldalkalibacillus uzonensis]|uniref:Arabinosaccharide transport system permease protein n=1 Tax=Caldalkalibacillus uzonensis TaxID=353224 RepID=A0ABU0CQG3_9BACI|nr:sugar ABC transporter permease [Caldalkalibacillus uzonensis]MDQ0338630.1 arabinosaccharide transport system permease protein [Caldalkalibacillus uzonensis]
MEVEYGKVAPKNKNMNRITRSILYSQKIAPYIFVLPFVILFVLLYGYPFIQAFIMSFQQILPGQVQFIGLANYERLLVDSRFYKALANSAQYTFWTLVLLIPLPMLFAVWLNSKLMYLKDIFRAAIFIPALTSVIVAGVIFRLMFGETEQSFANQILGVIGVGPVEWRFGAGTGMFLMVILAFWRWMGVNTLYFLAGLQNIPKDLYEAAEIDGAGAIQKFRYVTLPHLKPITIYVTTISIIAGFRMFEESFVYWQTNSPGDIGLTVALYIYEQGIQTNNMGYGAAVGNVLLFIILITSLIYLWFIGAFKRED